MVCWVRPQEKKELKEAVNGQFPLVFAKNYDDFKSKITEYSYLVFSATRARYLNKLRKLIREFENCIFYIYGQQDDEENEDKAYFIQDEPNVIKGQYTAKEFCLNFTGDIPDLREWGINRVRVMFNH